MVTCEVSTQPQQKEKDSVSVFLYGYWQKSLQIIIASACASMSFSYLNCLRPSLKELMEGEATTLSLRVFQSLIVLGK